MYWYNPITSVSENVEIRYQKQEVEPAVIAKMQ